MMIYEAKEEENKIKLTVTENSTLKTDKGTYYNTQNGITFKDKNTKGKIIISVLNLESITLSNENILENGNDDITFNFSNGDVNVSVTADSDDFSDFNFVLVNDLQLLKNFISATCFELGYYAKIHQQVIDECINTEDNTNTDNTGTDNTGTDNTGTDNTGTENTGTDNTGTENTGTDNTGTDNTGTDNTGTDNTGTENTGTENTEPTEPTNTEPTEPTQP